MDFEADLSEVDERAAALRCFKAAGRVEDPAKALEATEKSEDGCVLAAMPRVWRLNRSGVLRKREKVGGC